MEPKRIKGIVILCLLAAILAGCNGCATDGKQTDFDLRAYQAIGAATVAYDVSMRVCADLADNGKITETQWNEAAAIGRKVKAGVILASAAMMEYRMGKDAGLDTKDAKGRVEHALLVLARESAVLAEQVRVLSGMEATK